MRRTKVTGLLGPGNGGFGIGVLAEIYGYDRPELGLPLFDFALAAEQVGPMRTDSGFLIEIEHGLDRVAESDIVHIPSWEAIDKAPSPAIQRAIHTAYRRGATIASHCTGSFALAHAGLLDGQRATTHWQYTDALADRFPEITVEPGVLYVDAGRVLTSAGTAAGIDMCLYLCRREYGAAAANALARLMVVPPHREGGQAQFVDSPVRECDGQNPLADLLFWMLGHLGEELSVPVLSRRVLMSPRSFARHFRSATGTTPHAWVLGQRLAAAEQLLESGTDSIEEVATRVGFGSAATMRDHFIRRRGVSPQSYRRTFTGRGGTDPRDVEPPVAAVVG